MRYIVWKKAGGIFKGELMGVLERLFMILVY